MEEKNLVLTRLIEFIESKGGFSEVGRKIGKHSQMFHNLIRRNAKPSVETLEEIATQYADFDLNYIVRGKRTVEFERWNQLQIENDQLRRERNIFLSTMEKMGKHKGVAQPEINLYRRSNLKREIAKRGLH